MIGFRCPCGYAFEADGDSAEIHAVIDDHEQFCPMNEISSEHPAKNRIGADREQSNTLQGVEMSADKTTFHSTPEAAEVARLRNVRAMIVQNRDKIEATRHRMIEQDAEALASELTDEQVNARVQIGAASAEHDQLIASYDRKIAQAHRQRDFELLKAEGWEVTPSYSTPEAVNLEGPDVVDDSHSANAYFAWTPEDGTTVTIDTPATGVQLTLDQAEQFAYRLLSQTVETRRELDIPTIHCADHLDRELWETIKPLQLPDDRVTYRRTRDLPGGGRIEIDIDPGDGKHSLGHVDVIGVEDLPGIDALGDVALEMLEFVDECKHSRTID